MEKSLPALVFTVTVNKHDNRSVRDVDSTCIPREVALRTVAVADGGHGHHGPVKGRNVARFELRVLQHARAERELELVLVVEGQVGEDAAEDVRERQDDEQKAPEAAGFGRDEQRVLEPALETWKPHHSHQAYNPRSRVQPRSLLGEVEERGGGRASGGIRLGVVRLENGVEGQRPQHFRHKPAAGVMPEDGERREVQLAIGLDRCVEADGSKLGL
jgi:hypothetical protein